MQILHRTRLCRPLALALLCSLLPALAQATLLDAVRANDAGAALSALADSTAGVNERLPDGSTALLWAVYQDEAALVQALLEAGADPALGNDYGITPLYQAARNGNPAILALLLDAGLAADTPLREGETALMVAALAGSVPAVEVLLQHGADVNARESWRGQTALMWAASQNHAEVVSALLDAGADAGAVSTEVDFRDLPAKRGSVGMIFPRGGFTPLLFAARDGALESAGLLLQHGVSPDQADPDGTTPLIMAIINFHYDIAALLLQHDADVSLHDDRARTALYAAVDMHSYDYTNRPSPQVSDAHDSLDIVRLLLARPGIDVDAPISKYIEPRAVLDGADTALGAGSTPFMRAARAADLPVMQLLIDAGADVNHRNEAGATALMLASGLDWRDGKTRGTEAEVFEAVTLLLSLGADPAQQDAKGNTALHGAAGRGVDSVIRLLAEHGADPAVANADGETPLDLAAAVGGKRNALDTTVALLRSLVD